MVAWMLVLAASILTIELARALSLFPAFAALAVEARRAIRLMRRMRVSDWAKERAMRLLSASLLGRSCRAAAILAVVSAPVAAALWWIGVPGGWLSHLLLLVATLGYSFARRRLSGERVFERLTLGNRAVRELSFDLERSAHRHLLRSAAAPLAPVFITGLARAGTTILMRALHDSGAFASLTYRDLPLPLAPNLWARATSRADRAVATRERGHGDGILHDLDSPEAIEEVFWLTRYGGAYRGADRLVPAPVPDETRGAFRDYVTLVQHRYGRGRYLSKNNSNVLRLSALVDSFPDAVLIHPFRDPLQQAMSLARQHANACALGIADPYRRDFMTWLGHHEFGADHRPFVLRGQPPASDPGTLDHWLSHWIEVYSWLLDQPDTVAARQVFVDFDAIADDRQALARYLATRLNLTEPLSLATIGAAPVRPAEPASELLVERARRLHARLQERYRAAVPVPEARVLRAGVPA